MDRQNLTLLTDLYELTMMQGYFKHKDQNETVIFDAFFRNNPMDSGYSVFAGLDQVINYIMNLRFEEEDLTYLRSLDMFDDDFLDYLKDFKFSGDIYALPEGSVMFPREPMIKVIAPIMEAQLVETAILTIVNHQSLIATKASRVCYAAKGDGIMEFGLRRAQGPDAGIYGARAAMIGGCVGTSNVLAGQLFHVPVKGTHAHSWIMSFQDEYTAFKTYAKCTLLPVSYWSTPMIP
jgi:nicotinate phosphoribosyltransferase